MANMLLVALGSSGDVNPFVGIGLGLKERGHNVTVLTNEHFRGAVEGVGLGFAQAGTEAQYAEAIGNPEFWHPKKGPALLFRLALRGMADTYERIDALHVPGDTIVAAPPQALGAPIAAEKLGLPFAMVFPNPLLMRSAYSPPKTPMLPIPNWLGPRSVRLLYRLLDWQLDRLVARPVNEFRVSVGLAAQGHVYGSWRDQAARIIGLWPDWLYGPQPDWPEHAAVTGFIEYDGAATVDTGADQTREKHATFAGGEKPIVFTCGTAMASGHDFYAAAVDACRVLDRPGLLLTQWTDQLPSSLPSNVRHLTYAPLGKLLPNACALVHHGGIGTAARALAAGIPQVIMPLGYDQFDNVDRLKRLGVGASIKRKGINGRKLARAIGRLLDDPEVSRQCRRCAERLAHCDAVAQTCEHLESLTG